MERKGVRQGRAMQISAQPFGRIAEHEHRHNVLLSIGNMIGSGGSVVVTECSGCCDGPECALSDEMVAKIYKVRCDADEPPEVALQEARMLQAVASEHVAAYLGLYHFEVDSDEAEQIPAIQSVQSTLNGHFGSRVQSRSSRSKSSSRSTREAKLSTASGDGQRSKLCALLMERMDYSLHHLTCFSFLEPEAAFACQALLRGLSHLHSLGIIHRDVKPGNILIANGGSRVVLSDLGLAARIPEGSTSVSRKACGTRGFLAPECLLRDVCSKESDMFAVGAVLYQLLFGTYAFVRDSVAETEAATLQGKLPLEPCGEAVGKSDASCVLVQNLLDFDPVCRLTAREALRSPWFQKQESLAALHSLREEAKTIQDETALGLFMTNAKTQRRPLTKEVRVKKSLTQPKATWASRILKVARRSLAVRNFMRSKKVAPEPVEFDEICGQKG
eukprot:s219_g24.t1